MPKYSDAQIRQMILDYLVRENEEEEPNPKRSAHYRNHATDCRYSIIENYTPNYPGWRGDVLTVLYGFVEYAEVFAIENGGLRKIRIRN